MAFCEITDSNFEAVSLFVFSKIRTNPEKLKDFKEFSKEVFSDLIEMKASVEKAITLMRYLPVWVAQFNSDKIKSRLLKTAGVSLDAIRDVDELFDDYNSLAKYLGIKDEVQPIVVVHSVQLAAEKKITDHILKTKVELVNVKEGEQVVTKRKVNGKLYGIRVTSVAKVGFDEKPDEDEEVVESPALKHGTTVNTIATAIFNGIEPKASDFADLIDGVPFNALVSQLKELKTKMEEEEGMIFKTAVTVYNEKLDISGEIDLVAINPKGEVFIMDFKTSKRRFNELNLKNEVLKYRSDEMKDVTILSQWKYFVTQGALYGMMLSEQLGLPVTNRVGIIGANILYDQTVPAKESKITKLSKILVNKISVTDIRAEFKGKTLPEIVEVYKSLEKKSLSTTTEVFPIKKTREKKNYDHLGGHQPLERMAKIEEIALTDAELQKEVDWWNRTPMGKHVLLNLDSMVNAGLFGKFATTAVTIFKNASKGTLYHEGWHTFSQIFMTKEQKEQLYKSVRDDNIHFTTRDGRKLITSTAPLIDVEEFLAEEFAKFGLNPEEYKYPTPNPKPKSLFQRMWEALKRWFGVNPRPITLFQKLYRGKVAEYIPSVNNAYWNNLNSIAMSRTGVQIIANERLPVYEQVMSTLLARELRKYGKSFVALKEDKKLQSRVLEEVFADIREKYRTDYTILSDQQKTELENIIENQYEFTRIYLTVTKYKSLKDFKIDEDIFNRSEEDIDSVDDVSSRYSDVEDINEDEDASRPDNSYRGYNNPGDETAALTLAEDAIQDFFQTIPKLKGVERDPVTGIITKRIPELNELGYEVNHSYYDVFYKTKKILAGAFEMSDILARMADLDNQRRFPELSIVHEYIVNFINNKEEKNHYRKIQNIMFLQSFAHVMGMPEVTNMQLSMDLRPKKESKMFKSILVTFRRASRNLTLKIIKTWEKNFKDRREKVYYAFADKRPKEDIVEKSPLFLTSEGRLLLNPFLNYKDMFPSSKVKNIESFYEILGIEFNPKVMEDREAMQRLKEIKTKIIQNITLYNDAKFEEFADAVEAAMGDREPDGEDLKDYFAVLSEAEIEKLIKEFFISNVISEFNIKRKYAIAGDKKSVIETENLFFVFEELAEIEEKFGERVSSGAYRIEDKTKYPYYIPSSILITTNLLNKTKRVVDFNRQPYLEHINPASHKWMNRSYFFKNMFDYNGERTLDINDKPIQIVVEDTASVRTMLGEVGALRIIEQHPRSLNKDSKFFMDVLTLFKAGVIEGPRAEGSSTIFSTRLSSYGEDKNGQNKFLPISYDESLGEIPETFHDAVKDYFFAEIEKRQWYMANEPEATAVKVYEKGPQKGQKVPLAKQFNVFEGLLPEALRVKVEALLDMAPEEIFTQGTIHQEFREAVDQYFRDRLDSIKQRLEALPDHYKKVLADAIEAKNKSGSVGMYSVAKAFVMNHFILSMEYYGIYFGDLYFYKNPFRRGKYTTNTGTAYYVDDYRNEMLNSVQDETLHSIYTGSVAGGKDFRTIKTGIANDIIMKSSYVDRDDNNNRLLQDIVNMRVAAGTMTRGTPEFTIINDQIKKSLEKYYKINVADGQGVIGLDFYRNFSIITKIWSEDKEKEYERQKAIFRNHFNLYFTRDDAGNKVSLQGAEYDEAVRKDKQLIAQKTGVFFNPLKISYTGPQVKEGPMSPVFDKFSVRPIIPEVAIGRRDEAMLLEMTKQDMDYIKFESGSKVYKAQTFDWFKKVEEGEYDLQDFSTEEIVPNELRSAYLKHQLSTEGYDEKNILGSQFRKIFFGIKYSPLVRDNPELVAYFSGLEKEFFDTIVNLLNVEQDDLFSLLGIEEVNDEYRVKDMQRFITLLRDEALKRGHAINNIDYIEYDEITKGARRPIEFAFNRQQIQDLLAGMIDDRLRRLKINSLSLIQVSSAGFENQVLKSPEGPMPFPVGSVSEGHGRFRKPTREEIEQYGSSGLHYYHINYKDGLPVNTSTMGVKVAMLGEFKNLLNLPAPDFLIGTDEGDDISTTSDTIRTVERLNEAMRNPEWKYKNFDKFILVGYRIPTQNNNFIDRMEIMEFLPESAGSILIAPMELIIKSGSDFDIDKMSVLRYSYKFKGGIKTAPSESIQEIRREIGKLTFEDRNLKAIKKELNLLINRVGAKEAEYSALYRKIRYTILDIVSKMASEAFLERITKNILDNKDEIIPQQGEEHYDYDLFAATLDLVIVERELKRTKGGGLFEETFKEELKIVEKDLEWFDKKKQYKNAQNNNLLRILDRTLSSPYYFEMLVTPTTTGMFDEYTNALMGAKANMTERELEAAVIKNEGKLFDKVYTPEENIRYETSLEAFDNFLPTKKDLGGYAIQRTFADIFNFIRFSIAQNYTIKDEKKTLYIPLIDPKDRHKVLQNGRILMYGESVSGIGIKDAFDQLISLVIDLGNSPAYPKMGINQYNKKIIQYLIHQKVDPKNVLWFVNQPILQEVYKLFERQRREATDYTLKHAITQKALDVGILKNPPKFEKSKILKYQVMGRKKDLIKDEDTGEEYFGWVKDTKKGNHWLSRPYVDLNEQNLTDADHFSFEQMDAAIRSGVTNTPLQKKVLAYFGSLMDEADSLMMLQFANNVDTNKYSTLTSIIRNQDNKRKIRNVGLFDNYQLNKLEKESMIAPFDYTKKAMKIQKLLFPKLYTNRTIGTFAAIINDIYGAKNIEIERVSKIIENDYIEMVYKNFGTFNGRNLSDYFEPRLINLTNSKDHQFFSYRLNHIKGKYDELASIPFVDALSEDVYFPKEEEDLLSYRGLDNKEIRNTFFLRHPDNPTAEKNIFTNNWRNLINFDPAKLGLKKNYTDEQVTEISQFFHELIYFALYQSGLTNTGNGFSDLIPYEHWSHFIQEAFANMDDKVAKNKDLEEAMLKIFEQRFKEMNYKIAWGTTKTMVDITKVDPKLVAEFYSEEEIEQIIKEDEGMAELDMFFYKNYYRGKDYRFSNDDLGFSAGILANKRYDPDLDSFVDTPVARPAPAPGEKPVVEPGRYVEYKGKVYIVLKPTTRPKVWQIYDPLSEGRAAKLSIHQKNLTPRSEMGIFVNYPPLTYLVTTKKEIIDMTTLLKVDWSSYHPTRVAIIQSAMDRGFFPPGPKDVGDGACKTS